MAATMPSRRAFLRAGIAGGLGAGCLFYGDPLRAAIQIGRASFNVRDFGAVGDGRAIDTPAVNRAIDAAAAAGGGTVWFPPGHYLCYTIRLKSHVTLAIDAGATVVAADQPPSGRP